MSCDIPFEGRQVSESVVITCGCGLINCGCGFVSEMLKIDQMFPSFLDFSNTVDLCRGDGG